MPDFKMDAERRMRDPQGRFKLFSEPTKNHAHHRKDGRRGEYDTKTGKVVYESDATVKSTENTEGS
jgi:hypothetical protein